MEDVSRTALQKKKKIHISFHLKQVPQMLIPFHIRKLKNIKKEIKIKVMDLIQIYQFRKIIIIKTEFQKIKFCTNRRHQKL
jgi:hypothetical protein